MRIRELAGQESHDVCRGLLDRELVDCDDFIGELCIECIALVEQSLNFFEYTQAGETWARRKICGFQAILQCLRTCAQVEHAQIACD